MSKKNITIFIIILLCGLLFGVVYYKMRNSNKNYNDVVNKDSKVLVVYYSAQGHTDNVAKKIASNLNADVFLIEPKDEYTSDDLNYSDSNSRVSKEHNDESLRDVELKNISVDKWNDYDVVLIGYPIWWGCASSVLNI